MLQDDINRHLRVGIYSPNYFKAPPPPPPRADDPPEEFELIKDLRRIHESSHLVVGHLLGLQTHFVDARRTTARVSWTIPGGRSGVTAFLVALAASKPAQKKFGASHHSYTEHLADDERKINHWARKLTACESDAQGMIAATYRAAAELVDGRWNDILWCRAELERLDDFIEGRELSHLLRRIEGGMMRRRGGFIPSASYWTRRHGLSRPRGFDAESREIDAVLSTGMAVRRQDWDGAFDEVLGMKPENVRMGRLNQGAAVLDSHNWSSGMGSVLGGIVPGSARISNGELTARIKFSRGSELARRVAQDLQDGIQIPLSVGYKVHATIEDRRTNPITRTAMDWEPIEVSVVPVAAEESGTGFRVRPEKAPHL
jgi:hypothetical protein